MLLAALPPIGWAAFGWVCFVPLLIAVRARGLAVGFVSALASCLLAAWLSTTPLMPGLRLADGSNSFNYVGFAQFGLVPALLCATLGELKRFSLATTLGLIGAAILGEWALQLILPAHLALSQAYQPNVVAWASLGGVWLVSLAAWVTNLVFAFAIAERRIKLGLAILAVPPLMALPPWRAVLLPIRSSKTLKVAVIQADGWDLPELGSATREAKASGAELVLWPELSADVIVRNGDSTPLKQLSSDPNVAPFMTTFSDNVRPKPHNSLALFASGVESARYFKQKPFGGERNEHVAGSTPLTVTLGSTSGQINIACAICFDACYPSLMRRAARTGSPSVLVIPSLDPMSTTGFIQASHASFSPFRAAELGLPVIRSDVSGYSQLVNPNGVVVKTAPLGFSGVMVGDVRLGPEWTLYRQLGDWVVWLAGGLVLYAVAANRGWTQWLIRRKKTVEP